MEENAKSLRRFPAMAAVPEAALSRWSGDCRRLTVPRDGLVFSEGEEPEAVFFLDSGLIKTLKYSSRLDSSGMGFVMPGEVFGAIARLDRKPYPVTAVAVRESLLVRMPAAMFDGLMADHPSFSRVVYTQIGAHVRAAQTLKALMSEPAPRRLGLILLQLNEANDGKEIRLLREDLASMAGLNFSTTVRILADLRRRGYVSTGWKRLRVISPEGLEKHLG